MNTTWRAIAFRKDWIVGALMMSMASVACGGRTTNSLAKCSSVPACGGDLTGAWHVRDSCGKLTRDEGAPPVPSACQAEVDATAAANTLADPDFTIEFHPYGSVEETGTLRVVGRDQLFTSACQTALGGAGFSAFTCVTLAASLLVLPTDTASCTFVQSGCRCSYSQTQSIDVTADYHTTGRTLFLSSSVLDESGPYCVTGNTASVHVVGDGVDATLELERQ